MLPSISSTQFLLFYLILLFVPSRTVAYRWQICSTSDGHFTDNSTYEANLNLLLSSLVSNGSGSGFSTGTVGRVPNQVQGLVLCRGDTNATTCGSCLSNGAVEIRQICAYDRDAVVWYDECLLRFSNLQFLSTSDNDPTAALENVNQVNDDPDRFNKVVTELLDSTADWAAYNSTKRYATGQAFNVTPAFPTIYALAQCTPDMSASDCRNCLEGVSQGLPMARMGARNQGVRCNLRYESSLFFQGNPIIRLISPVTNATTPAENATTPASAPTSHPAVGPIGKEDQTDSEQATQVIESLLFRLATLRVATVNFAEANKLGEDAVRGKQLTWGIRYKIICGIARGLLYLHEESQLKIIHRDLKASNILLDADMNPKISDFGLAKLFDIDQTQGTTNRVMGTFGYMAPEYVMRGKFSIKSDVFSFGVLVLEILTGRKSNGSYNPEVTEVLLSYKTIVAISISAVSAVLLIPIIYICYRRLRKQTSKSPYGSESEQAAQAESLLFQISALRIATANFSEENKLGEGGFGAVYKGVLPDGREIAVKRLLNSGHGLGELKNELVLVAKLRHRNLVKLLGVCLEEEKMIVYEYDIKASNILLDADMNPKITDFGFAKLFDVDQTQAITNRVVGTFGYMAPEYVMHGKYSIKSDVFGFGVLVLEILTGRKSSGSYNPEVIEVLLSYAWEKWREGSALEIVDPTLGAHYQRSDLLRYMHIGLLCVQEKPNDRPTMSIVVVMLNSETLSLRAPSRPGFYLGNGGRNTNFDPRKKKTILAISISAVSAVLLLSIIYACSMRLRKQILKPPYATDSEQATQVESLLFDLSTLRVATVNFSEENKLGEGGFGAVYKGVLPDGRVIAVKRLLNSGQGLGELKNELALVAKLQHRNLVKLLGVCLEEEKMIVYEYVPNTSLDKFLFDPVRGEQLTWGIRYKIICGIARGLLYLHEESQLKIIHRDLKACNILLDADMNPKISDFGSAKLFDGEQTQGMTSRVVGTYGYMAPEYVIHGQFSIKSDVFSFGVLVLEILTGRKNSTTCNPENTEDLLSYTWEKWRGGLALEMENPFSRPTMSTITVMLNTVLLLSMRNPGAEGDGVVIEELLSMRTTDAVVKGNGMDTNRSSSIIHPCVGVSKEAVISPSGRIFCGGAATAEGVNGGGEASLAFVLRHVELAKRLAEDLVWGTPCRSVREAGGDGGRGEGREEEVEVGMVGAVGGKVGVCWTTFP
ncbi:Cysteine-rich receptor-like protein kinase [Musa troglodytarum]|uniref:Cysteine-rich receptor-like protein kinase n=1 Tax=Musa troglodytarum TaxID=320322 RepID=A0A9E7HCC8_9LILI|nr:Cysteine-rich receptor-like protein kinase [Musa troglodytarum]